MTVLAIDQGTSSTKALVVDDDGNVLAEADRPVRPRYLEGGGVEVDPGALLDSLLDAAREAVRASRAQPQAIALANQGETVLAWDRATGEALSPAIVWQDRRAQPICDELRDHSAVLAARTGLKLDPYFSAPKMAWIRRQLTGQGVVTTTDTWLVHKLCGAFVTDVSTASRSMLVDLGTCAWSLECLATFGLTDEELPDIVACDEVVGTTTLLGPPMAVGGLIVDQAAALLAQGCTEAGSAKCTFGTGAFLLANCGPSAVASTAGLTTSVAWQIGPDIRYYMDGQVYAAGSALRWLQDLGVLTSPTNIDSEAAPDAGSVICVPSFAGLASPWWQPTAAAAVEGLSLSTGPGQLIAAVLEGIAAQLAVIADAIAGDLKASIQSLQVDGGLTKSSRLMQAVSDVLQRPVIISPHANATAIGAASLGHSALGHSALGHSALGKNQAGGPHAASTSTSVFNPRWSPHRAGAYRAKWARLAAAQGEIT